MLVLLELSSGDVLAESLSPPVTMELSEDKVRVMASHMHVFTRLGLHLTVHGRSTIHVHTIPKCCIVKDASEVPYIHAESSVHIRSFESRNQKKY